MMIKRRGEGRGGKISSIIDPKKTTSSKDSERTNYVIQNWMRTRSTVEFLGLWEKLHNLNFNSIEFDAFRNESGSNSFSLTPQRWIEKTNAIGLVSKAGRYGGGTYAHKDIAFEFASPSSAPKRAFSAVKRNCHYSDTVTAWQSRFEKIEIIL